jgi:ferredoxin-NADP reductase
VPATVHEAEVLEIHTLSRGAIEYRLKAEQPLTFRPGQFISLRVGRDADDNPVLRSYSIASRPGRSELSLVVKLFPGGAAHAFFSQLATGQRIAFTGPMGFFVLDLQHTGDVIFGATGVGIAPVLPMATEALERSETGRVLLFWGNRDPEDLFWTNELEALAKAHPRFVVRTFISGDAPDWTGERGRILKPIMDALPKLERPTFYLVGSGGMIREVKAALVERGIDRKRQIRNEVFFD